MAFIYLISVCFSFYSFSSSPVIIAFDLNIWKGYWNYLEQEFSICGEEAGFNFFSQSTEEKYFSKTELKWWCHSNVK